MKTIKTADGKWKRRMDFDDILQYAYVILIVCAVLGFLVILPLYVTFVGLGRGIYFGIFCFWLSVSLSFAVDR